MVMTDNTSVREWIEFGKGEVKEGRQWEWEWGRGRERIGGNMVARRIGIAQSVWLFKGHILFEGPHPTLRSTSVCPSRLLPQLSPSATGQFIVLGYLITAHILQV